MENGKKNSIFFKKKNNCLKKKINKNKNKIIYCLI